MYISLLQSSLGDLLTHLVTQRCSSAAAAGVSDVISDVENDVKQRYWTFPDVLTDLTCQPHHYPGASIPIYQWRNCAIYGDLGEGYFLLKMLCC